jgi:phosphatidylglycerophosphate synthase
MSERLESTDKWKHVLAIGITASRLIIADRIAKRIETKDRIFGLVAAFIVADIVDGVVSRKPGVDTPLRRFTDAFVDRASMMRASFAMAKANPASQPYLVALGVREAAVGLANATHFVKTGEVVQGHGLHKLDTLSIAAFGMAASSHSESATHTVGMIANAINYGSAVDYVSNAVQPHGYLHEGVRHIAFEPVVLTDAEATR